MASGTWADASIDNRFIQRRSSTFTSSDGNWVLVFNGEIYNYKELRSELKSLGVRFRTRTDTEVLLNSWIYWGSDCLSKLKGMFAFTILDRKKNLLTCVRDAFGIKPGTVMIATEGGYSTVLVAGEHYIKLEKDCSNIDEILEKINDYSFVNQIKLKAKERVLSVPELRLSWIANRCFDWIPDKKELESLNPYFKC